MNTVYGKLDKIFLHVYNFGLYENKVIFEKLEFKNIRSKMILDQVYLKTSLSGVFGEAIL